jgi:hypothetical protein
MRYSRLRHASVGILLAAAAELSRALAAPAIITVPSALNLGTTSFFDGFGKTGEGFTLLQYARYEDLNQITDAHGNASPAFKGTDIQVFASLTQIVYSSPLHPFGGDSLGLSALLPVINLNAHFASDSPAKLTGSGVGFGDLVWGPSYQSKTYRDAERPVFSWRFQLLVMSPTGHFDRHDSLNQSAGYWGINPYVAFTWLPTPELEISSRLNYQHNLSSSHFADTPSVPGVVYLNGQAGDLVYGNLDASWEIAADLRVGINGYFLDQLSPDQTNGQDVAHSLESQIYLGPGARLVIDHENAVNANLYLPVECRNCSQGPRLNFQFTHRF